MPRTSAHRFNLGPSTSPAPTLDVCAMVPVLVCAYSAIIAPLIYFAFPPSPGLQGVLESRIENRFFWPAAAGISVLLAARYSSRLGRLSVPPNITSLLAYLAFAGASVAWAFRPELTLVRFVQEVMVLMAIVLPGMLAARNADIMRGVFLCFAFASVVNVLLIPGGYVTLTPHGKTMVDIGYQGYFTQKNLLGEMAAVALLLSIHELLFSGHRRALGIIIVVIATVLLFQSNSKTALGLALVAPILAGLTLMITKRSRVSPAIILVLMAFGYAVLAGVTGFNTNHIAYLLTGDSSFTGRTVMWDFAEMEIARSPLIGWGYQSFWLVGPDAPSVVDAPGWLKTMPNAHNGYYDTVLELGYVGLALLITFIITTLHVIGRVVERDYARAWLLLSVVLFIIIYNFLETLWLRAFDLLWVVFVIVAVEAARYWQPLPLKRSAQPARPVVPGRLRGAGRAGLGSRLGTPP
jgi:exopolysaccharide production protein ExoQ